jgi:uncharacterized membrane protein YtjA (UPF0391 family)
MLHYAVIFFVIALIAALFGFGGIAAGATGAVQTLYFVFIVLGSDHVRLEPDQEQVLKGEPR